MKIKNTFDEHINSLINSFVNEQKVRFPQDEILTIDLHCHDYNSNVPDELLAAGAVVLRPLTVDRVGALGEGCQVGGPEVVTGDGSDEQGALGHLGELGGYCLLEDVEVHCGSFVSCGLAHCSSSSSYCTHPISVAFSLYTTA